ncbi:MAG: AAA family ATPase [Oscillospiraceae bacterium]|nr:AAA family ATPase [Oscillospiraceae bacterium]
MTNDINDIKLTDEEIKAFCTCNGMSDEQYEKLIRDGYSTDEIFKSAKEIVLRGESLADDCEFKPKLASEFTGRKTRFVWYPYIPIGDYTVLMADGVTGKTIFCCGILATMSNGRLLPGDRIKEAQKTLFISAEDTGDKLHDILKASGADLDMIHILDCTESEGLNFTDRAEEFKKLILQTRARLVIIDPWHAFLGADVDINRVNAVRPVFQRLANIAKDCDCGLVLVSHVNKRAQGENANNAATGSTDFVNAARSAMRVIFSEEPDGENCRIVVHTKSNYAQAGESVKFRINDKGGCVWAGFSEITRRTVEKEAGRGYIEPERG